MPAYLEVEDTQYIHGQMVRRYGGLTVPGSLDCLDAALAMPRQSAFGRDRFGTLAEKAAAYLYFLATKHCFPDGNKRTAAAAALLFIRLNGCYVSSDVGPGRLAGLTLDVVRGRCSLVQRAKWFERRLVALR